MASKKSIYSGLLFLTLGALVPVTSFADDGIATNDALITQPTAERGTTGSSTAPSDGDLARSNDSNTGATTPTAPAVPEVPATPETPTTQQHQLQQLSRQINLLQNQLISLIQQHQRLILKQKRTLKHLRFLQ